MLLDRVLWFDWNGLFFRPDLRLCCRRAERRSGMAGGHRGAARSVLDGREHGGRMAGGGVA